jgi:hypothetical protein
MGWLATLIKKNNDIEAPLHDTDFHEYDHQPLSTDASVESLHQARSLISGAAIRTAQVHGVPASWLSFEVFTISDNQKAYFQLQILMNHWDESLLMHAYAFECAVVKRIREESVEVGRALRAVHWRVAPEAGCPYDAMPEPQYWGNEAVKQRTQVRQRIQREIYAATTPAAGAIIVPVAYAAPANAPGPVAQAMAAAQLLKDAALPVSHGFNDTHSHNKTGFSATHPYDPKKATAKAPKSK